MAKEFSPSTFSYHLHKGIWLNKSDTKSLIFLLDMFKHALYNPETYMHDYQKKLDMLAEVEDHRDKLDELLKEGLY